MCQEFGRIGHLNMDDLGLRSSQWRKNLQIVNRITHVFDGSIAHRAQRQVQFLVVNRNRTTCHTQRNGCTIRSLHKRLFHKGHSRMSNDRITIHLTDLQSTLCTTTTRRLMRQHLSSSLTTCLPLILHHVLQSHTIHGSNEDCHGNLLSCRTIIHYLITILLKSHLFQDASNRLLG